MDEKNTLVVCMILIKNNNLMNIITFISRSTFWYVIVIYFCKFKLSWTFILIELSWRSELQSVDESSFSKIKLWKACEVTFKTALMELKFMCWKSVILVACTDLLLSCLFLRCEIVRLIHRLKMSRAYHFKNLFYCRLNMILFIAQP